MPHDSARSEAALEVVKIDGPAVHHEDEAQEDVKQQLRLAAQAFLSHHGTEVAHQVHEAQKMLESLSSNTLGGSRPGNDGLDTQRVIKVTLARRDLTYRVSMGRRRKRTWRTVLQGSSGTLPPGRLLAVLGPTGSGKTSLLNALAARLPTKGGQLEGEVLVNGLPRQRGFRKISAYVLQDDVLFHNLTVRETFDFAAAIRLPPSVPLKARRELVGRVITELGLAKAEHTFIGNAFVRGVSGGERKRVNIGIQLMSNPSLIFLDEPTSGLDAFQAQNVMEALWALAHSGRSVMATIHQPRSSIFKMFDLLMLVSEGQAMYWGPASQAVSWFESCGFPCPEHFNPADFFIDVVSLDFRSPQLEAASRMRVKLLARAFREEEGQQPGAQGQAASAQDGISPGNGEGSTQALQAMNRLTGFPNPLPREFGLLLQRAWRQQSRDRLPQVIAVVQSIVIGFILAALYANMEKDQTGIQDEIGVLFFVCIFVCFNALFGALNTFPTDKGVVNRDRASKAYRILPYYLSRFVCDLPLRVGQGLLFGVIIYWIIGLNPAASAFFIFVALLILAGLASQGLGIAVSAGCKNEKIAFAIAPAVTVILILFGGFYVNKDTIPKAIRWIEFFSHLYWSFMGVSINDFRGREGWTCEGGSQYGKTGGGCLTTGEEILDRLGFSGNHLWQAFLGLGCLILFYNALGYLVLRLSKPRYLPLTHIAGGRAARK